MGNVNRAHLKGSAGLIYSGLITGSDIQNVNVTVWMICPEADDCPFLQAPPGARIRCTRVNSGALPTRKRERWCAAADERSLFRKSPLALRGVYKQHIQHNIPLTTAIAPNPVSEYINKPTMASPVISRYYGTNYHLSHPP
jgi:hypothetical protein